MNSFILCSGVESKFGISIGRIEWLEKEKLWRVMGLDGQNHGQYEGVVASDKNIVSSRFTDVTGRPPPLGTITFLENMVNSFGIKSIN